MIADPVTLPLPAGSRSPDGSRSSSAWTVRRNVRSPGSIDGAAMSDAAIASMRIALNGIGWGVPGPLPGLSARIFTVRVPISLPIRSARALI